MTVDAKICTKCHVTKGLFEFSKKPGTPDGLQPLCKPCASEYARQYRKQKPEAARESLRRSYLLHRDKRVSEMKAWLEVNREEINKRRRQKRPARRELLLAQQKQWRKDNPDLVRAMEASKNARRKTRAVTWNSELTDFVMREAMHLSRIREAATAILWHVDHQVPLQGKRVCGLHVWNNLSVVPAAFNLSKNNKFGERWMERVWL